MLNNNELNELWSRIDDHGVYGRDDGMEKRPDILQGVKHADTWQVWLQLKGRQLF